MIFYGGNWILPHMYICGFSFCHMWIQRLSYVCTFPVQCITLDLKFITYVPLTLLEASLCLPWAVSDPESMHSSSNHESEYFSLRVNQSIPMFPRATSFLYFPATLMEMVFILFQWWSEFKWDLFDLFIYKLYTILHNLVDFIKERTDLMACQQRNGDAM